ncbi:MAG: PhzF family phenazine biosynthesis protein [Alphaproteobacteria bacterium]
MKLPFYWVDAFAERTFAGNPAGVVPLESWIDDRLMQSIAAENNLAETAFFVPKGRDFQLRWFTPTVEVAMCGHATLASGHVVMTALESMRTSVTFHSLSGPLGVARDGERCALDFPNRAPTPIAVPAWLGPALGAKAVELHEAPGENLLAVLPSAKEVRGLAPNMPALAKGLGQRGIIVTAPGEDVDFVSRYFAPNHGIPEDPVTGSAHCTLTPYWAKRLGKTTLEARQVSARGGRLTCTLKGDRVAIAGRAITYMTGTIEV